MKFSSKYLFLFASVLLLGVIRAQDDDFAEKEVSSLDKLEEDSLIPAVEGVLDSIDAESPSLGSDSDSASSTTSTTEAPSTHPTLVLIPGDQGFDEPTTRPPFLTRLTNRFAALRAAGSRGIQRLGLIRQGVHVDEQSFAYRTGRRISLTIQSLLARSRALAERFIQRQAARVEARQRQQQQSDS